jgi:cysteine desulfurase / selenocysteine lyase
MEIAEARNFYPYLNSGRIYMNHAAVSPLSTPVVEKLDDLIYERSTTLIEDFSAYLKLVSDTKSKIGELINADPDRIAFVENTSNGLNILAQGLDWKPGGRIILNDIEFPSNIYPFMNLKSYGVEIDFVKSDNGKVVFDDIEAAVTPDTMLISISSVQFLSGYRAALQRIGELCKSKNIIFCVDGIQSLGAIKMDVKKYNINFLSTGGQKWLMALQGLGFIFIDEELQERIKPKYVGWTSVANAWELLDYNLELRKTAERFQNGTVSALGIAALNASLSFFKNFGYDEIEKVILNNTIYFINSLNEIGVVPLLNGVDKDNLSGIVSFRSDKAQQIFSELEKENVVGAVREGIVRFSPHFYNNREEIDRVVNYLKNMNHLCNFIK